MVAKVPRVVVRVLVGYPGWFLRCCYAVARVPSVFAKVLLCGCNGIRVVARVCLCFVSRVPGCLLRSFYAVAKVPGVVAWLPWVVSNVLLCGC